MAGVSAQDIADYGDYLKSQGHKAEDVSAYTQYLAGHHEVPYEPMSTGQAAAIKGEEGMMFGLRPVVAGAGAAIGNAVAQFTNPNDKPFSFGEVGKHFMQGRDEANQEQNQASKDHPFVSAGANLAGNFATLPFLPAKGLAGAVKLGAGLGAAQAAGSADSLKDAAIMTGGGAVMGSAAYGVGKALGAGASALADSEIGQTVAGKIKTGLAKTASALTGVPDKEIETYATQYDKVKGLLDQSGGSIPVAAEIQKENLQAAVRSTKDNLNAQISQALQKASPQKNIDLAPIVQKLESYKGKLNSSLDREGIRDIDELIQRVKGSVGETAQTYGPGGYLEGVGASAPRATGEGLGYSLPGNTTPQMTPYAGPQDSRIGVLASIKNLGKGSAPNTPAVAEAVNLPYSPGFAADVSPGKMIINGKPGYDTPSPKFMGSIQDLQKIKKFLSDQAAGTFEGSALGFQVGKTGSNAAKDAFMMSKNMMDQVGPAEIKNANRQLFQLHKIEDRLNKNLVIPGKSDAALMAVGSGAQNRDALALQRLGQLSGHDFVGDASVLSAANRFNSPSFSPAYGTGKSLLPVMMGGAVGGALDPDHGRGALIGAGIGGALASPASLKLAIDTGRISVRALNSVANAFGVNPQNIQSLAQVLQTPQAQEILIRTMADENQAAASQPKTSTTIRPRTNFK